MNKPTFQKYPAYKPSGVEWLRVIPEHWECLSNKFIFKLKKNLVGKKSSEFVLLSLTLNGVIKRDMENPQGKFPAEFDTYQEVKKGDFIFCLFDVEETPRTVGLSDHDGMITGAYTVLQPHDNFDKSFLYYFYLNLDADKRMKPLYTGLRNTISKENFFGFKTFIPPLPEQTAIAHFLDTKTAQVDRAIAQKEKLIALLKERKQIVIQQAVTGKVSNYDLADDSENYDSKEKNQSPSQHQKNHSSRPMKHSGVEWIGEIPEEWEVKRLKHFVSIQGGFAFDSSDFKEEGIQIIKIANTYMNELCLDRQPTFVKESYLQSHRQWVVSKGDILMSLTGTLGKRDYGYAILISSDEKYMLNQRVAKLTVRNDLQKEYLLTLLYSECCLNQLYALPAGTKQANLSNDNVININIPVPPKIERFKIIEFINTQSTKIDKAITVQEQQIEKLKEYKAVLVDSAVTGKIKVSNYD